MCTCPSPTEVPRQGTPIKKTALPNWNFLRRWGAILKNMEETRLLQPRGALHFLGDSPPVFVKDQKKNTFNSFRSFPWPFLATFDHLVDRWEAKGQNAEPEFCSHPLRPVFKSIAEDSAPDWNCQGMMAPLLMVQKSGNDQLRLEVYPIIYKLLYKWLAGFLPSTVSPVQWPSIWGSFPFCPNWNWYPSMHQLKVRWNLWLVCLEDQQQNKHSNTSNIFLVGGFNPLWTY